MFVDGSEDGHGKAREGGGNKKLSSHYCSGKNWTCPIQSSTKKLMVQ